MDLTKHYQLQDLHTALEELHCIDNCKFLLEQAVKEGKFKSARFALENISRSVDELEKLHSRKIEIEKIDRIAEELREREVNAKRINRRIWNAI